MEASPRWSRFVTETSKLQRLNLSSMTPQERTVFFVNVYNVLVINALVVTRRFPRTLLEWRYLECTSYYSIGGMAYCLADILHGHLRFNSPPPWSSAQKARFGENDPRALTTTDIQFLKSKELKSPQLIISVEKKMMNENLDEPEEELMYDPRILFTISSHDGSSPSMLMLQSDHLDSGLKLAAEYYFTDHYPNIDAANRKLTLPDLFFYYKHDFVQHELLLRVKDVTKKTEREPAVKLSSTEETELMLRWISRYLTGQRKKDLEKLITSKNYTVSYNHDWTPRPKPLLSV